MGLYNVIAPCVIGKLHYVRPTEQPIQVDDEVAALLVESGNLTPYGPLTGVKKTVPDLGGDFTGAVFEAGVAAGEEFATGLTETEQEADKNADESRSSRRRPSRKPPEDAA